ncbi:MAG TPA: leucine-rich repeat domain-containing protein [Ginsengibacter sp.]
MADIIIPENWWNELESQWRKAFGISVLGHQNEPNLVDLENIFSTPTIRLAGPTAPFPNMHFELTNLSGLQYLSNLSIAVITHHKIEEIEVLSHLTNLKSLFLFNNNIKSLHGIEGLIELEQLYVQCNQITSIKPIEQLINLKEFYINDNRIETLDGLTEKHSDKLTMFMCRPNEQLKQKEIIRAERELGIICRR